MKSQVNDLVSMRDVDTLAEILAESDDWLDQLDAAEGLVRLGDRRGLDHLLIARESEIDEIRQVAREILADPEIQSLRAQIDVDLRFERQKLLEAARKRLEKGRKVFLHKVVYLPAVELMQEDDDGHGFQLLELVDAGLEGWEVVSVLPRRHLVLDDPTARSFGAYAFLRREVGEDELTEIG